MVFSLPVTPCTSIIHPQTASTFTHSKKATAAATIGHIRLRIYVHIQVYIHVRSMSQDACRWSNDDDEHTQLDVRLKRQIKAAATYSMYVYLFCESDGANSISSHPFRGLALFFLLVVGYLSYDHRVVCEQENDYFVFFSKYNIIIMIISLCICALVRISQSFFRGS